MTQDERMDDSNDLLNTIDLAYAEAGQGDPLVLIHGLGGSRSDWELQWPALTPHFRMVTPDLRGHGASPRPPGPYRIGLFAADVATLMRRIEARPAHVVGLSLGGAVAQQLALDAPELVRSLVLVNTAASFVSDGWRRRLMGVQRFAATYFSGMDKVAADVAQRLFPHAEQAPLRNEATARLSVNAPRAYRELADGHRPIQRHRPAIVDHLPDAGGLWGYRLRGADERQARSWPTVSPTAGWW